jgi:hypothetical protein
MQYTIKIHYNSIKLNKHCKKYTTNQSEFVRNKKLIKSNKNKNYTIDN